MNAKRAQATEAQNFDFRILDDLTDGVLVIDSNFCVRYANSSATQILGTSERMLKRITDLRRTNLFEKTDLENQVQRSAITDQTVACETELNVNGEKIEVELRCRRISERDPSWMLIFRNVSLEIRLTQKYRTQLKEKKEANLKLRLSRHALKRQSADLELFLFILSCAINGFSYLATKYCVESIPPAISLASRMILVATLLLVYSAAHGRVRVTWQEFLNAGRLAVLRRVTFGLGMAYAVKTVPSGVCAAIAATMPLWMVLFERKKKSVSAITLYGLGMGLVGLTLLGAESWQNQVSVPGFLFALGAAISFAFGTFLTTEPTRRPMQTMSLELLTGGILLLVFSIFSGEWNQFSFGSITDRSLVGFVFLTVFNTFIATTAFNWAVSGGQSASRSTSFMLAVPVIALVASWLIGGEALTLLAISASALLVGSIYLIRKPSLRVS